MYADFDRRVAVAYLTIGDLAEKVGATALATEYLLSAAGAPAWPAGRAADLTDEYIDEYCALDDKDIGSPLDNALFYEYFGNMAEHFGELRMAARYFVDAGDAFMAAGRESDADGMFALAENILIDRDVEYGCAEDGIPDMTAEAVYEGDVPDMTADAVCDDDVPDMTAEAVYESDVPDMTAEAVYESDVPDMTAEAVCDDNVPDMMMKLFLSSSMIER